VIDEIDSEKSRLRTLVMRTEDISIADADKKLDNSSLSIHVTPGVLSTPAGEAALITAILLGARCFGKVLVSGDIDHEISSAKLSIGTSVSAVMAAVGATFENEPSCRTVAIGDVESSMSGLPFVVAGWDGWQAFAAPGKTICKLGDGSNPLAGIAAAAMALGSAFMSELGDPNAGRRIQEISLWAPGAAPVHSAGPASFNLPHALWLIGLGNLGQAYLWCLSWLPYADPGKLHLTLQDFDRVSKENWGTSILVERGSYGMLKTRAAEDWALFNGFSVNRIDRPLDEHLHRNPTDPSIALVGLDRIAARRALGAPGFKHIIDAGLGSTLRNFRDFRINVFGKGDDPKAHFRGVLDRDRENLDAVLALPSYRKLLEQAEDGKCGALILAEQPIVLPFISALTAALAVAQAIRLESGFEPYKAIVGRIDDMRSLRATQPEW
jgi:hypothetical protein